LSKVIDVVPTENVAPTETVVTEPSSFAELRQSWTPEQRQKWDATGEEPTVPAKAETVVTDTQPESEKAKDEPASGAGEQDEDHEPEYVGSPEQIRKQKHAFAKLKRERAEARAEAKILREQLAGHKPAAPAAAPKAEQKPTGLVKPKPPRLTDAKYQAENGIELFDADMEAWSDAVETYREQKAKADREAAETQNARRSRAEAWASELEAGREAHEDFDAVAFSPKVPASLPMLGVLMGMKGSAELLYFFGKNPEAAKELAELSDIPGTYQTYDELAEAAQHNPSLKIQLGIAEGLVKAEIRRIQSGKSKDLTPKPITVSRTPAPAEKVNASASVTKDPIAEAWSQYDKTGDHKYLTLANKLEDERDRAARHRS
jgi:hypothetical protein